MKTTPVSRAIPTLTHMAIKSLLDCGKAKFLISQNTDGLHVKSGVSPSQIAELHGNSNLERCNKCEARYYRDFRVRKRGNKVHNHITDRKCVKCGGSLRDTIINFNENLDQDVLELATAHSWEADLMISLGSSLTVSPANSLVGQVANRQKHIAVINMQKTEYDKYCTVHCHSKVDYFMQKVCEYLKVEIRPWRLTRFINIQTKSKGTTTVACIDDTATPFNFLKSLTVKKPIKVNSEGTYTFKGTLDKPTNLHLEFYSHYKEPALDLEVPMKQGKTTYKLEYNYYQSEWKVTKVELKEKSKQANTTVPDIDVD